MIIIRNIPFHGFLLGPLFIFFLYVHNFNEVHFENIGQSLVIAITVALALFAAFYACFRWNAHKAGFMLSLTLLALFSYGIIYNLLEKMFYAGFWPLAHIHRYLSGTYCIFLLFLFLFLFMSNRSFKSFTLPLNIFIGILYLVNLIQLGTKATPGLMAGNNSGESGDSNQNINNPVPGKTAIPDIYYIILDGYAHDSILYTFYGFRNNPLTQYLLTKGFFLAGESASNYPSTSESLGSSLNLDYLDNIQSGDLILSLSNNKTCQYLKSRGFYIPHIRSGYSVTRINQLADTVILLDNVSEFERGLLRYTIFRLDDLTGYLHYLQLHNQMKKIYLLPGLRSPKFVFIHIVSPHPPFICSPEGKYRLRSDLSHQWWEPKSDYINQLEFINANMQRFIDTLLLIPGNKPIIIIQSDHGPWMKDSSKENIYLARSLILNTYYIPYEWSKNLYSSITPVNTFRLIFNGVFNDSLPLLPDKPFTYQSIQNSPVFNMMTD